MRALAFKRRPRCAKSILVAKRTAIRYKLREVPTNTGRTARTWEEQQKYGEIYPESNAVKGGRNAYRAESGGPARFAGTFRVT